MMMKKFAKLVLVLVAVFCITLPCIASAAQWIATRDYIRLRATIEQGDDDVLTTIRKGDIITGKKEQSSDGTWWIHTTYHGYTGYTYAPYYKLYNGSDSTAPEKPSTGSSTSSSKPAKTYTTEGCELYYVTPALEAPTVSIYSIKDTSGSRKALLVRGEQVWVRKLETKWAQIVYDGHIRYILTKYIVSAEEYDSNPIVNEPGEYVAYKTGRFWVRMYSEMSATSDILFKIEDGTPVIVTEDYGGWVKVTTNGKVGYVISSQLQPCN